MKDPNSDIGKCLSMTEEKEKRFDTDKKEVNDEQTSLLKYHTQDLADFNGHNFMSKIFRKKKGSLNYFFPGRNSSFASR